TNEREVFRQGGDEGWVPYGDWNAECRRRHAEFLSQPAGLFSHLESLAKKRGGITMIHEERQPIGLVTQSEEIMEELILELDEALLSHEDFSYQRNTVYLRFCLRDYHKGSALAELC